MEMKRLLVTGGAGFFWVVPIRDLTRNDYDEVLCMSNHITDQGENVPRLIGNPHYFQNRLGR